MGGAEERSERNLDEGEGAQPRSMNENAILDDEVLQDEGNACIRVESEENEPERDETGPPIAIARGGDDETASPWPGPKGVISNGSERSSEAAKRRRLKPNEGERPRLSLISGQRIGMQVTRHRVKSRRKFTHPRYRTYQQRVLGVDRRRNENYRFADRFGRRILRRN